ncbi:MAG: hypothetical protein D9V44_00200 [Actinobacteria bacterium]|nr:MAG: hypothetical protein D9V44_00200 [Actinomycetota bacterium]
MNGFEPSDVIPAVIAAVLYAIAFSRVSRNARRSVDRANRTIDATVAHGWFRDVRRLNAATLGAFALFVLFDGVRRPGFLPVGVVLVAVLGAIGWLVLMMPIAPHQELFYVRWVLGVSGYSPAQVDRDDT